MGASRGGFERPRDPKSFKGRVWGFTKFLAATASAGCGTVSAVSGDGASAAMFYLLFAGITAHSLRKSFKSTFKTEAGWQLPKHRPSRSEKIRQTIGNIRSGLVSAFEHVRGFGSNVSENVKNTARDTADAAERRIRGNTATGNEYNM